MWWQALAVWNAFALLLMSYDKLKAKSSGWRVSERTLLLVAALFGSPGILCGMYFGNHKTRKPKFTLGVPFLLIVQVIILTWFIRRNL